MRISDWSSDVCSSDLTQGEMPLTDPIARFVTRKAYEKAGGPIRRDLFSNEGDIYLIDRELVERLAKDKLERRAARSEERRVGKEGVSTGRSRWSPAH